jgi:hypothetical protein
VRSSGKHLNAVLSCLQWMKSNLPNFVRDRAMKIDGRGRIASFDLAVSEPGVDQDSQGPVKLEYIELAPKVLYDLRYCNGYSSEGQKKIMSHLILITLNNNEQYISAISTSYRHLQVGV